MNTKILIIICFLVQPLFLTVAEAGCNRGTVTCDFNAAVTKKTCKATLMCNNAPVSSLNYWAIAFNGSDNVSACIPFSKSLIGATVTFSLTAIANPSYTIPDTQTKHCQWLWLTFATTNTSGFVNINDADGLPVELMEFSVEESDE